MQKLGNPNFNDADMMNFWNGKASLGAASSSNKQGVLPGNQIEVATKQADAYKAFVAKNAEEIKAINEQAEREQKQSWDLDHDAWVQAGYRTAQDEATLPTCASPCGAIGSAAGPQNLLRLGDATRNFG